MKNQEEIENLADKWLAETPIKEWGGVENGFIVGYTKCQEDLSNSWAKGCECKDSIGQTWCCNICSLPYDTRNNQPQKEKNKHEVTRFEVIDENGMAYTKHNCKIELSYQDDGRTLKVFIKK